MRGTRLVFLLTSAATLVLLSACRQERNSVIKMATTTSVQESGLLDAVLPIFEKESGYKVHVIAVGSGKALKHGENGDVDVVFTHDPDAEGKFIKSGFGINRREVMYNYFVIVGPEEDPASIKSEKDSATAFRKIAQRGSPFISRGDESGTHAKEKELWRAAEITPSGRWYVVAGQGMSAVITMADQLKGYTLTDKATYLSMRKNISIVILCAGDEKLLNKYSIMAVNPAKQPHVNFTGATKLIDWFTSPEAQNAVANFKKYGEPLFYTGAHQK